MHLLKPFNHALASLLFFAFAATVSAKPFEFALIGDLPYGVKIDKRDNDTEALFSQLNSEQLSWVLHVGDIKKGISTCSDSMLEDRAKRFASITHPFVLTPGDNDWTDCHRALAGRFDPLDRLAKLRNIFYSEASTQQLNDALGSVSQKDIHTEHSEFFENLYWQKEGVSFATIHIVGSSNGKEKFSKLSKIKRGKTHKQEVNRREKAAKAWLSYTFDHAKQTNTKAIFLAIHANTGLGKDQTEKQNPFAFFNKQLLKELKTFEKPVVLAHGDSHYFRIDKPSISGRKAPSNFVRLESFGENNAAWVKVYVDSESKNVFRFSIHQAN